MLSKTPLLALSKIRSGSIWFGNEYNYTQDFLEMVGMERLAEPTYKSLEMQDATFQKPNAWPLDE